MVIDASFLRSPCPSYKLMLIGVPNSRLQGFAVVNNGVPLPGGVSGTSASTPVFAAMVALINDARIAAGTTTSTFLFWSSRMLRSDSSPLQSDNFDSPVQVGHLSGLPPPHAAAPLAVRGLFY